MSCQSACRGRPSRARRACRVFSVFAFLRSHPGEGAKRPSRRMRMTPCFETPLEHEAERGCPLRCDSLVILVFEIALHLRRTQQLLDALSLREALVDAEADIRREFQVD